ncbi:MAG: bifunctional nuclease family protein [Coriobacteriaceae bacterium]|nr:bifunctional nuclease family protein [Coriobacteriaceae bacterium]
MIPVHIESIAVGMMPAPSVISLRPCEKQAPEYADRSLPIQIGPMEAGTIGAALEGRKTERPLTHDVMNGIVESLDASISRAVIDRVEKNVFYATVYLRRADGMFTRVDARPSDAIALAIKAKAPLFVEEDVIEAASCPDSFVPGSDQEMEIEMEEFHKFIENVDPEDFVTDGNADKN